MTVDYGGTYRTFPTFEVNMDQGENGFIAFVDTQKHIRNQIIQQERLG